MAKKKSTGKSKGINLLKGITGTQLAKLATLVIILLAIPLTVIMSRQAQNLSQEAASKTCTGLGGNVCECKEPRGGKCITDTSPKFPSCTKSGGKVSTGYCPGRTYCCVPQGIDKCMDIGHCQYTYVPCPSGKWKPGVCPGPSNFKCCLDK
jgi:hypothetical protein